MWLRRLGAPPLWPSRCKVICLGLFTFVFTLTVFQYLRGASAQYLDLLHPADLGIQCLLPDSACVSAKDPLACMLNRGVKIFAKDLSKVEACPWSWATVRRDETCANASLPLSATSGQNMLHTAVGGFNPFKVWSILFLVLMSMTSFLTVMHDLALLEDTLRPQILTLLEMNEATPRLWECLMCMQCRRRSGSSLAFLRPLRWNLHLPLRVVLYSIWLFVGTTIFMAIVYPFSVLIFLAHPVRMSRVMVFLSGILGMLWALLFMIMTVVRFSRQEYRLLWSASACICSCKFPLAPSVSLRMIALGMGMMAHSFNVTFRALKGLRRTEWANLISVLYSVPVEAFPVVWERPKEAGGGSIRWREDGEPVQGEPAFDPFCLMDEQPESAWTRVKIEPVPRAEHLEAFANSCRGDTGCCGFPCTPRPPGPRNKGGAGASRPWVHLKQGLLQT